MVLFPIIETIDVIFVPMFLRKTIENLLNDRDIKRNYHHELRIACENALKELNAIAPVDDANQSASSSVLPPSAQAWAEMRTAIGLFAGHTARMAANTSSG